MEKQCLNCQTLFDEEDRFCRSCGQSTADHSRNLGVLLRHFLADYFTFDNKLFRSLMPLLFKPGFLTLEYMKGRRVSYVAPLRIYLFISIAFFLILSLQGNAGEEMDRFFGTHLPRLFFLLLPMFALFLRLLYLKSHKNLVTHFLFAVHFHSFMFLTGAVLLGINSLMASFDAILVNQILAGLFGLIWLTYLFLSMRRVYADKGAYLVLRFLALIAMYLLLLTISIVMVLLMTTTGDLV